VRTLCCRADRVGSGGPGCPGVQRLGGVDVTASIDRPSMPSAATIERRGISSGDGPVTRGSNTYFGRGPMCANLSRCSPGPWPSGYRSGPVPRPPPDTPVADRHRAAPEFDQRGNRQPGRTGKWLRAQDRPRRWRFWPRRSHPTARIHYPRWSTSAFLDSSPFMGRYSGPGLPPRPFGKVTPWWTFVERSSPLVDPGPNLTRA
jgi:hypothetical protein